MRGIIKNPKQTAGFEICQTKLPHLHQRLSTEHLTGAENVGPQAGEMEDAAPTCVSASAEVEGEDAFCPGSSEDSVSRIPAFLQRGTTGFMAVPMLMTCRGKAAICFT